MTRITAIASQKGGVGKTTTAVNLAAFMQHAGKRTLLVDLDPQGNATSGIGADRANGLRDLLAGNGSGSPIVPTRFPLLSVLPSFERPESAGEVTALETDTISRLSALLREGDFERVIIDCPPSFGPLPRLALAVSDSVLIPVQAEYYAMEGLSQILPLIEEVQAARDRPLPIEGILVTMFAPELELSYDVLGEIRSYFPDRTLRSVVPRDVMLAEAASHGLAICEYDLRSCGAWAYASVTKEILSR